MSNYKFRTTNGDTVFTEENWLQSQIDTKNSEISRFLKVFVHKKGGTQFSEASKINQSIKQIVCLIEQNDDLYSNKDMYEESDYSVGSAFDTIIFLVCFITFFTIILLISIGS